MLHTCVLSSTNDNDDKDSIEAIVDQAEEENAKANKEWRSYLARENSLVTKLFGGNWS